MPEEITMENVEQFMAELRAMARALLRTENRAHSVRATGLVMTALRRNKLREQEWAEVTWNNRQYFFGAMHQAMRRALIDYAKVRDAQKRPRLEFVEPEDLNYFDLTATLEQPAQIEALEEALVWLEKEDAVLAEIVQLRYFSGFNVEEVACWLDISERTIKRKWVQAKLMLHERILRHLNEDQSPD